VVEQKEIFKKIHEKLENYGFILRYLEGKEKITGYSYEPWHLRFVQVDNAKKIKQKGVTLEEYLGKWNKGKFLENNLFLVIFGIILSLIL
jgi:D-alanyl-D-alanine carboxypeptidase